MKIIKKIIDSYNEAFDESPEFYTIMSIIIIIFIIFNEVL